MPSTASRLQSNLRRSRLVLYTFVLPILALTLADAAQSVLRVVYIILGFSLIIFLHELGHFVVARLCSVKCLAFSLGIGPRMCGWRSGGKFNFGNDPYDPENRPVEEGHALEHAEAATTHSDLPTTAVTPPHPPAIGDCDYRLSWLPLGGYVRMLGQDDMDPTKISNDPHAFNRRPIWQRMCIVSAGVVMNVIFAAVVFSIIFYPKMGVEFPPARIGPVTFGSPAWEQNLRMGDEVLSINNQPHRGFLEFTDLQMESALSDGIEEIKLRVRPFGTHGEADRDVSLLPKRSDMTGFLAIGVDPMPGLKIGGKGEDYTDADAEKANRFSITYAGNKSEIQKIEKDDKIVGVNGIDLHDPQGAHDKYAFLYKELQDKNGDPVTLHLENTKTKSKKDVSLVAHIETIEGVKDYPVVLGMEPQIVVGEPLPGKPAAKAGLESGDRIIRAGVRINPSSEQFQDIVHNSNGEKIVIGYARKAAAAAALPATSPSTAPGATVAVESGWTTGTKTITPENSSGTYLIGVSLLSDLQSTHFIAPSPDSPVGSLGLPPDATIAAINGKPVANWQQIYNELRKQSAGATVNVAFADAAGKTIATHDFTLPDSDLQAVNSRLHYMLGLRLENETKTQVAASAGEAVMMGLDHTKKFILQVYSTLNGLARRTVSPDNLHGIVGITKVGYDVQERGTVWLWYVLAMVSVNLAVANFLPLPIVDGGLFLLLILEKIRGKPLSLKVQSAIQVAGIVLLAGLFLYVTKNDIMMFVPK